MPKFAIFMDEQEAIEFANACTLALGYPKPGVPWAEFPTGWTISWAVPTKHPTEFLWTVPIPPNSGIQSPLETETLSADWYLPVVLE